MLASQGVRFENGHVNVAVCQPSRGIIATGRYSHNNGIEGFFHTDKNIPDIISLLKSNGYYTGVLGKVDHSSPKKLTPWDIKVYRDSLGKGRNKELYYTEAKNIIKNAKREGKPFYMMANSSDPHRPFVLSKKALKWRSVGSNILNPSRTYTESEITIPGFLPELPLVRKEVTQYFNSVKRLDDTVGRILDVLEEEGVTDNTIVMFLSDNGMAFPFAKTNCYLQSTNTPWIVRWPGKVESNTINKKDFISGIDFFPTILEAANLQIPDGLDGTSFVPTLLGKKQEGRDKVFTQFFQTSSKKRFPMRCIQDAKYGYIFNAWSDGKARFRNESQIGYTYKAMVKAAKTNPNIAARVKLFDNRVVEEFYDFENDPNALNNLINIPEYKEIINKYRAGMEQWMEKVNDPALSFFKVKDDKGEMARLLAVK
jgi:N-sulfoglucosamine sulfohydrolase